LFKTGKIEIGRRLFSWCNRYSQYLTSEVKNIKVVPGKWIKIQTQGDAYCFGQELTESERIG
jgi:hypothetical protein